MKKYIHIKREDREFIAKLFKVTDRTVHNAIRFDEKRGNTVLAKKIRKVALERGGITMVVAPEVETFWDSDNVGRQYFPNGALVELDRNDGRAYVIFKGDTVKVYENVMLSEIQGIQQYAEALR